MRRIWMAVVFLVLGSAAGAVAGNPWGGDFSADMIGTSQGQRFQAKLYVSGDKTRMEMMEMVVITRLDKNVAWMIMPAQNMYMEQAVDYRTMMQTGTASGEVSRKPLGTETIDGKPAQKFEVTYSNNGKQESVYQWMQGEMPVRVAAVDGSWVMEYKNVQKGSVSADLFEVPAGYQKFAMPSMSDLRRTAGAEAQETLVN